MNFSSLFNTAAHLQGLKKKNDQQHQLSKLIHDEVGECEEFGAITTATTGLQAVLVVIYLAIAYYKRSCRRQYDVASESASPRNRPDMDEIALDERGNEAAPTSYDRLLALTNTALYIRDGVLLSKLADQDGRNNDEVV